MAWRSPFADGPCTVKVIQNSQSVRFDGKLSAGQSETFTTPGEAGSQYVIAVSQDGAVSLTGAQAGGSGGGWDVRVTPDSAPTSAMQVSGILANVSFSSYTNYVSVYGSDATDAQETRLSYAAGAYSPDPCAVPDPAAGVTPVLWGFHAEMTGV